MEFIDFMLAAVKYQILTIVALYWNHKQTK